MKLAQAQHTSVKSEDAGFIFDHLPKTGGTALRRAFEQIFGADQVSPPVLGRTERWAEKNFSRHRMIVGHFHSRVPVVGRSENRIRLTVLRDPVDRAVSEYFYYRNDAQRLPWHKLTVYSKDHDLYGYLKILEAEGDIAVSNRYAHHFAAQVSRSPWRETKLLSLSKEALGQYDFVGIQEQLSDFIDLFCGTYRLPSLPELPRANVTSRRPLLSELDAYTRDKLVRLNRVDLELYEFVRARFQERKRAAFRCFAARSEFDGAKDLFAPMVSASAESAGKPKSFGDRAVEICDGQTTGESSGVGQARTGENLSIRLTIASHIDVADLTVGIEIVDDVGEVAFGTNTGLLGSQYSVSAGMKYQVDFVLKADLRHGRYSVTAGLHTGSNRADRCFHWREHLIVFDVVDGETGPMPGYCDLDAKARWTELAGQRRFEAGKAK